MVRRLCCVASPRITPRRARTNVNVSDEHPLRNLVAILGGMLALAVLCYWILGFAVDIVAPHIPLSTERRISDLLLDASPKLKDSMKPAPRLQHIAGMLHEDGVDMPVEVYRSSAPIVNAFALPGGRIVICKGLLDSVRSENELAFIIAHEMGHIAHRDAIRKLGRALVFMAISASFGGVENDLNTTIAGMLNVTELGYSRTQETAADEYGVNAMLRAYGHSGGITDFFERLAENNETVGWFDGLTSTHPELQDRIKHLREYARSHGGTEGPLLPVPPELGDAAHSLPTI